MAFENGINFFSNLASQYRGERMDNKERKRLEKQASDDRISKLLASIGQIASSGASKYFDQQQSDKDLADQRGYEEKINAREQLEARDTEGRRLSAQREATDTARRFSEQNRRYDIDREEGYRAEDIAREDELSGKKREEYLQDQSNAAMEALMERQRVEGKDKEQEGYQRGMDREAMNLRWADHNLRAKEAGQEAIPKEQWLQAKAYVDQRLDDALQKQGMYEDDFSPAYGDMGEDAYNLKFNEIVTGELSDDVVKQIMGEFDIPDTPENRQSIKEMAFMYESKSPGITPPSGEVTPRTGTGAVVGANFLGGISGVQLTPDKIVEGLKAIPGLAQKHILDPVKTENVAEAIQAIGNFFTGQKQTVPPKPTTNTPNWDRPR